MNKKFPAHPPKSGSLNKIQHSTCVCIAFYILSGVVTPIINKSRCVYVHTHLSIYQFEYVDILILRYSTSLLCEKNQDSTYF